MRWGIKLVVGGIRLYQRLISPLLGPRCCFYPTCSNYAIEALKQHGLFCGSWLAIKRISRCHPGATPGEDPVPTCGCRCRSAHAEDKQAVLSEEVKQPAQPPLDEQRR